MNEAATTLTRAGIERVHLIGQILCCALRRLVLSLQYNACTPIRVMLNPLRTWKF